VTTQALLLCAALLPAAGDVPSADAGASDLAKMQGDWMVASITNDGIKLSNDEAQTLFRTVSGNQYTIFNFNKPISRGTFKIDATKKPKTIDSTPPGPPGKVKPTLGIYEFNGDTLKICNGRPGMPRPTSFDAKADSNQTCIIWQPEKK
jgi:uncharacterized protein (TIGR03067 family)